MAERKLPIGVQSFEKMITEGYYYVDKTQYIAQLLKGQVYFLSRQPTFAGKKSSLRGYTSRRSKRNWRDKKSAKRG